MEAELRLTVLIPASLAHEDAVKKSLVLHQDLSPGNMIIVDGRGMLIDWDLSKRMSSEEPCGPRRPMRTVRRSPLRPFMGHLSIPPSDNSTAGHLAIHVGCARIL